MPEVWRLAGITGRAGWQMLRDLLQRAARAGGAPPSLDQAVGVVDSLLPASADRCALALHGSGLTGRPTHPSAVRALADLWGRPAPGWRWGPAYGASLVVGDARDRQHAGLPGCKRGVGRAGALAVDDARARLAAVFPCHGRDGHDDLMLALGVRAPGTPVVWDRGVQGRLIRPVRRLLAGGTVGLAGDPGGHDRLFLTPLDRVVVDALRRSPADMAVGDLVGRIVAVGASATPNAAKTHLGGATYLTSTRWGRVGLAGGHGARRPVTADGSTSGSWRASRCCPPACAGTWTASSTGSSAGAARSPPPTPQTRGT